MSAAGLCGWVAAGVALAAALLVRRTLARRMEAVARACHEVRGPLTAARLGLSLGTPGGLSAARVRAVESALERATLAVQDLADAGVAAAAPVPRGRVAMSSLLLGVVAAAEGQAHEAGVAVRGSWTGPEGIVWGERLRLAQALGNLVANAVEHGAGPVDVRGEVREASVRIEIADSGPGMSAPIRQLARRPRSGRDARGRGLAIASAIAQHHGGALTTAPAGRGAVVVLTLPALVVAAAQRA